jgi:hypothetical protein
MKNTLWAQRMMWVVWPAFVVACLLEILVFACVDPSEVRGWGSAWVLPPQGVYTVAFFAFWVLAMLSSSLTLWLSAAPVVSNRT